MGGGCANCFVSIAILTVWLAFACSVAALFAPAWVTVDPPGGKPITDGLYMTCLDPYGDDRDCDFKKSDDADVDWKKAVVIMWPISAGLLLFCSIGACFMCCDMCKKAWWFSVLGIACFLAFGLAVASVVVYGVKTSEDTDELYNVKGVDLFDRNEFVYFDWGYYLAITTGCLSLLAFLFFDIAICCLRQ